VDQLCPGQFPKKQQTSTAWVMESPMAAIESGSGGAGAAAEGEAEAGVAAPRVARSRATPRASTRNGLGISDLPGRAERDAGQRMTGLADLA
jgi:hypothetical protein